MTHAHELPLSDCCDAVSMQLSESVLILMRMIRSPVVTPRI